MERIRRNLAAIAIGLFVAVVVAAIIDGREFLRVREIAKAYGHDHRDALLVFGLVLAGTFVFAAIVLAALAALRSPDRKALLVVFAIPSSLFACLPVYWYEYRDAPPGWHINIADEHSLAPMAGVAAGLIAYGFWRLAAGKRRDAGATPDLPA